MEARELEALLARVESAERPSRTLDCALARLDGWERQWDEDRAQHRGGSYWGNPGRSISFTREDGDTYPPNYTASLDAALALVERVMPAETHWRVEKTCERPALSFRTHKFTAYCGDYGTPARSEGATPPLALIAALLRAKAKDAQTLAARRLTPATRTD